MTSTAVIQTDTLTPRFSKSYFGQAWPVATNGYEAALRDYGGLFFVRTSQQEWTGILANLNRKLGDYKAYTIHTWRVGKTAGTTGVGTTVIIQCHVKYARHEATETFTMFKGKSDASYKIVSHDIQSNGLLTE